MTRISKFKNKLYNPRIMVINGDTASQKHVNSYPKKPGVPTFSVDPATQHELLFWAQLHLKSYNLKKTTL
jgi:hypothetical protein